LEKKKVPKKIQSLWTWKLEEVGSRTTVVVDKNMKNEKYGTHLHRLFDKPEDTPYLQNRKHRTQEA